MGRNQAGIAIAEAVQRAPSLADLERARREFFELSRLPAGLVPDRVLRSWQRCAREGMEVDRIAAPEPLGHRELEEAKARAEALLALAEPEMEFLHETLEDSDSLILLADARGMILDARGVGRFMQRAARVALMPGVSWSEGERGTNAVGTAIADNHLVEVWGSEHFHLHHRILCCTAAPILDHRGEVAGVIDVSGDARLPRGYARAVVKRAVREIEHRWIMNAPERLTRLRLHPHRACLGSYQEGVLLLRDGRIEGANRAALRWLGTDWSLLGKPVEEVFAVAPDLKGTSVARARNGDPLHVSADAGPSAVRPVRTVDAEVPAAPAGRPGAAADRGNWFNPAVRGELNRAVRAVNAGLSVMVLGETGSGKEEFVRAVHGACERAAGPLVAVNCAALPETLIEAELFGYEEGAFTGARRKGATGRILEADGGVLFLDEIGDMPLASQTRLLRVLQDRRVTPLGSGTARTVDCVVVCATHRDLAAMVDAGSFRADLYYRLQHLIVRLPAWRELSPGDRLAALDHLWWRAAGRRGLRLSPAARDRLAGCDWPGNLRQCANALAALAALHDEGTTVEVEALPSELRPSVASPAAAPTLETLTRQAIEQALGRHEGRVAAAARDLGIHRATLYRQMRQMGLGGHDA